MWTVRAKLCACKADYFTNVDPDWAGQAGEFMTTVNYLRVMEACIKRAPHIDLDTRKLQNEFRKELNEKIPKLDCFEHDWQSVMRQHTSSEAEVDTLPANTLMLIVDFKQNVSLPLAPQEGGNGGTHMRAFNLPSWGYTPYTTMQRARCAPPIMLFSAAA